MSELVIQRNDTIDARHKVDADAADEVWAPRGWVTVGPAANDEPDDLRTAEEAEAEYLATAKDDNPETAPWADDPTPTSTDMSEED